jgi:hypothetical protein
MPRLGWHTPGSSNFTLDWTARLASARRGRSTWAFAALARDPACRGRRIPASLLNEDVIH